MPNFDSPIGGRKFASQGMREFDVSDETEQYDHPRNVSRSTSVEDNHPRNYQNNIDRVSDFEKEVNAAREVKRTGREKISEGAKRRIEVLLGMVQTTREVFIEQNLFVLRTLKSKEMRDALMYTSEFDGTIQAPYEMRRQILSRSLTHVAGVEISQFVGSDTLESKLLFLDEMDESLLTRLYDEYVELSKSSKEKFAVKDEKEVQEVVEDIKK